MNGFEKRSIEPEKPEKKPKGSFTSSLKTKLLTWFRGHVLLGIAAIVIALLALKGFVGAVQLGNPFSVKQIVVSAVSDSIKTDEYNHTNILLIGVGGENHDGGTLTDTMIVASIDHKNNLVPMLSIPRDFYVENDLVGWGTRINSIYEYVAENNDGDYALGMQELIKEVEELTDLEIQYYAKIDFNGFVDIVNAVGGVTVDVPEEIYDTTYPADPGSSNLYQTFHIEPGVQELDGETALKYVRSRHTSSDFDRALRQQQVINAIKDKALSIGFMLNPVRIKKTISAISDNFETNLTMSEMLNFASLASDFDTNGIISAVLNDDPSAYGGILYAPQREAYGGAYVLVPYTNDMDEVHLLADILFHNPQVLLDQIPIQILNGNGSSGIATLLGLHLLRMGFNVVNYSNADAKDVLTSSIYIPNSDNKVAKDTAELLETLFPFTYNKETPDKYLPENHASEAEIIIELGEDFMTFYNDNEKYFYFGVY